MLSSTRYRAGWLLPALLLLAAPVHAQYAADARPTQDPFGRPPQLAQEVPGGHYLAHSYQRGILTLKATDGSTRQVQPWAAGVLKVSYFAPGRKPVADSSVSVVQRPASVPFLGPASPPEPGQRAASQIVEDSTQLALYLTPEVAVRVVKSTLQISLLVGDVPLFEEASAAFRRRPARPPAEAEDLPPSRANELAGTGVRFRLAPGERLYGTGARALPLNRRGYRLELYNQAHYGYQNGEQNLNVALPVVLSSRGYLLLFDHYAAGYLDLGKARAETLEYGAMGLTSLSYFVVVGQSQAEILDRYTALTGRQPLPPRWALGLIQSRFGYRSQAEMLAVADQMHRADFPLDALVLDLFWFGGTTRQGDFSWDAANFPDPAGMMRTLKAKGVNTILISEPYVMRTSLNDSLVRTQRLVGTTAAGQPFTVGSFWAGPASILDVFKDQTRTWLWAQYQRLHEQGAAGWWSDLGEPENHPLAMHHRLGTTSQVHNAYGITWAGIFQDNYLKQYPDERLFNLARSGWAGMQRNSVFPWSGDISRTWSGLQAQIPLMLGMGQAGVGYMHSDAGGFGANAIQDPELYTRWLQLAALCPIMRPHSDQVVAPEPYTYPEPYRSIVRRYAHLRYELLPYLYTLAAQNTLTGAPLARPMDFESPFGPAPAPVATGSPPAASDDQYLLGPNLLVAPISQPGQRRRNVVLPATPGGWVDWASGQPLPGGQTVGLLAPLASVPLLVRAGAFVPLTAYRASTAAFRADTIQVRYFPNPNGPLSSFIAYEDDGHSARALARKEYTSIHFTGFDSDDESTVTVSLTGTYPGEPTTRLVQLRVARVAVPPTTVQLGSQPLATTAWHYEANQHELYVRFALGQEATVRLSGLRFLTEPAAQLDPETLTLTAPDSRTFTSLASLHYLRYLPTAEPEALRICNAAGQVVRQLPTAAAAGPHTLRWDGLDTLGRPTAPGLYDVELAGQHQRLVRLP